MAFTQSQIQAVWEKGQIVPNNDPSQFRKDVCGAWMRRIDHGDRQAIYGWEVDHIIPNGSDSTANLQPLHWANNAAKGDGPLLCAVTSDETRNVTT